MKTIYKNKKIKFLIAGLTLVLVASLGFFVQSCSQEDDWVNITSNAPKKVGIDDFKNWFNSQEITNGGIGNQGPNWDNAELTVMPDGKTLQVSVEIYRAMNSLGNDSIRELQIAYVEYNFIGNVKVLSFFSENEYANVEYYSLDGRILEEGLYFGANQQYMSLKRYPVEEFCVRLKSDTEPNSDPCASTDSIKNSETPLEVNGKPNPAAYNCHRHVWGALQPTDPCYNATYPEWNECPNPAALGYSEVSGTPQVGDKCICYGYHPKYGSDAPLHSAKVLEVQNGKVTKFEAKCGDDKIYFYNPDCSRFAGYKTNNIKYYRN